MTNNNNNNKLYYADVGIDRVTLYNKKYPNFF